MGADALDAICQRLGTDLEGGWTILLVDQNRHLVHRGGDVRIPLLVGELRVEAQLAALEIQVVHRDVHLELLLVGDLARRLGELLDVLAGLVPVEEVLERGLVEVVVDVVEGEN